MLVGHLSNSSALPHFDLSILNTDLQAGLWVYSWAVEYAAILQRKPREVIRAHNGITLELAF